MDDVIYVIITEITRQQIGRGDLPPTGSEANTTIVVFISRGAGGPGREILQRPPSCPSRLSVRPSVRPSRLVFAL